MTISTLLPLEQIATEFNGQRDPTVLLYWINQYYVENGKQPVSHLDEMTRKHATQALGTIFDFKDSNPVQARQRFAEHGIFSPDLNDAAYDGVRENICQNLIDSLTSNNWNSYYTSNTLEEQILRSNRETILTSNAIQTFFAEQGYEMNEPSTMKNKVRLFFRKYMGAEDIDRVIPPQGRGYGRDNGNLPLYRRIQKEWANDEEDFLRGLFADADGSETGFIEMLARQRQAVEDLFGASYSAVINKCRYMGLLTRNESGGIRETGIPVYAFPDIHRQEFGDLLRGFQNRAFLLAHNIIPAVTQAFAYEPVPDERDEFPDEQFEHVTMHIWYRGVDIAQYTQAEQAVISAVQHYISDNGRFPRNERGDTIIDPAAEHGFAPSILQIRSMPNNLIQLTFRRRFNPINEVATNAINMGDGREGNGREIYLFRHELQATYHNTRV